MAGLGLLASYIAVHKQLEREHALRQGPPPAIAIQDLKPEQHASRGEEVRPIGEVDLAAIVTLHRRGGAPDDWVALVPVFPLSKIGSAVLASEGEGTPELVVEAQIARRISEDIEPRQALGLYVVPATGPETAPTDVSAIAETVLGEGEVGQVVVLNGAMFDMSDLTLMAHGALAANGTVLPDTFLAFEPWPGGRDAALSQPVQVWVRDMFFVFGLMLVVFAGALRLTQRFVATLRQKAPGGATISETSSHPKFAPLQPQGIEDAPRKTSFLGRLL